jgi:hypothetical protein
MIGRQYYRSCRWVVPSQKMGLLSRSTKYRPLSLTLIGYSVCSPVAICPVIDKDTIINVIIPIIRLILVPPFYRYSQKY